MPAGRPTEYDPQKLPKQVRNNYRCQYGHEWYVPFNIDAPFSFEFCPICNDEYFQYYPISQLPDNHYYHMEPPWH